MRGDQEIGRDYDVRVRRRVQIREKPVELPEDGMIDVSDCIVAEIRRTVTETDNLLFSVMTHNPQPLHIDVEAAKASEFGRILVNGTFTFALMVGLSVGETTLGTLIANLGYDQLVMPKPVFIGDTLRVETEVLELRESRSRPDAGIVTFRHVMLNQRGETVCECRRSALLQRRPT